MALEDLTRNARIIAIICNQWGDTGKGKFSDYFATQWADVTARGTGGNNAGHTVVVGGKEKIFHLIPAGISNDRDCKKTVLGNGMVIDLSALCNELDELDAENMPYNNLIISRDANVIMPYHIARDKAKDQSQKSGGIGSTGRGIGPCYTDKVARRGILVSDLYDCDILARKIGKMREIYSEQDIKIDDIISRLTPLSQRIRPLVRDTVPLMHEWIKDGKKILLEGAQGLLLSIEHGTYPYVTSSDCSLNGTASGVGISARMVDLPLGVVKFPFMTRVGAGPFPTELGGAVSEEYCASEGHTKKDELTEYRIPFELNGTKVQYNPHHTKIRGMINSQNPFLQGVGIRLAAGEYGATTGRPRRTGWTDAAIGKYATGINGPLFILTKADSLADAKEFKIGYGYEIGDKDVSFSKDEQVLRNAQPIYRSYAGYGDISDIRDFFKLPRSLRHAIRDFEGYTGGKAAIISVGADRDATIVR